MKSVQIPIFPFCSQQNSNKNIVTTYLQPLKKKECGFPTGLIIYFFDDRSPTRNTPSSFYKQRFLIEKNKAND